MITMFIKSLIRFYFKSQGVSFRMERAGDFIPYFAALPSNSTFFWILFCSVLTCIGHLETLHSEKNNCRMRTFIWFVNLLPAAICIETREHLKRNQIREQYRNYKSCSPRGE